VRFLTEVGEKTEQIAPELLEQPEIQKAINCILEAPLTKNESYLYEKSWDRISCERTLISAAREEAMAIGRARAIAQGRMAEKTELARKAKKMGLSFDDISSITGLSTEELSSLGV
jgi:predicted transposase/invertase (TIGR01784 family)